MALVEGALVAFGAMLCLGTCDFLGKKAVDKIGDFQAVLFTHLIGFVPLLAFILLFTNLPVLSLETILLILAAGFMSFIAWIFFYKSLANGLASVIVPIVGSWGVVTTLLALIVLGETPTLIQLVSIAVIFLGVFLTAVELDSFKKKSWSKGVGLAFLSFFLFGSMYFLTDFIVADIGSLFSLFFVTAVTLFFFLVYAPIQKTKIKNPPKSLWLVLAGIAFTELFASFLFFVGIDIGMLSVVSPIVAAYTPVTVILAYLFLQERVYFNQKIGIILTAIGLIGVSLI